MSTYTAASATIVKATAAGATAAGGISIPGLQVGDLLINVIPYGFFAGRDFEDTVSVADEIQQLGMPDWSSLTFTFYLLRGV
jgi:hypothetical protein